MNDVQAPERVELRCPMSNKLLGAFRVPDDTDATVELACRECKVNIGARENKRPKAVLHIFASTGYCLETVVVGAN